MASIRTQIYLTEDQRAQLAELTQRTGMSLAEVVRTALDRYLREPAADREANLHATFGAIPDFAVPSRDEWDRA